jgi:hypothetical protein
VDESIRVSVYQVCSEERIGRVCYKAAGGGNRLWTAIVSSAGATDRVITVVASTGHLHVVERFAFQGLRIR